jgi:hypothetical protein
MENKTTWGSNKETFGGDHTPKNDSANITSSIVVGKEETAVPNVPSPSVPKPHSIIFNNPFIKVKSSGRFIYTERKGVDSVAFILLATNASDERRIGLINEYKPPIDSFLTTAFGGSIDNEKYRDNLTQLVIDEVIEEAGFVVTGESIKSYGKVFCSTQMNQFVHLFAVEVDKTKQGDPTTTDPLEMKSSVVWMTMPEAIKTEDWKATTIITKRLASKEGYAVVRPA